MKLPDPIPEAPAFWDDERKAELVRNAMNGAAGQVLLSETDDVRVWSIRLAAGERVGFHRHVLNYFWVATRAGTSRSHYADGEVRDHQYGAGEVRHFEFGEGEFMLHDLQNIGEAEIEFVTVEFKHSANRPLQINQKPISGNP